MNKDKLKLVFEFIGDLLEETPVKGVIKDDDPIINEPKEKTQEEMNKEYWDKVFPSVNFYVVKDLIEAQILGLKPHQLESNKVRHKRSIKLQEDEKIQVAVNRILKRISHLIPNDPKSVVDKMRFETKIESIVKQDPDVERWVKYQKNIYDKTQGPDKEPINIVELDDKKEKVSQNMMHPHGVKTFEAIKEGVDKIGGEETIDVGGFDHKSNDKVIKDIFKDLKHPPKPDKIDMINFFNVPNITKISKKTGLSEENLIKVAKTREVENTMDYSNISLQGGIAITPAHDGVRIDQKSDTKKDETPVADSFDFDNPKETND